MREELQQVCSNPHHVKCDITKVEVLLKYPERRTNITVHLGVDQKSLGFVIGRAEEVKKKSDGFI